MLGMVLLVVPSVFGLLLWNSFRSNRVREARGEGFVPADGRQRWQDEEDS